MTEDHPLQPATALENGPTAIDELAISSLRSLVSWRPSELDLTVLMHGQLALVCSEADVLEWNLATGLAS